MNRGFTVVEVLVTLVVMAILLGLGTLGLRSTLANARDAERKDDIETIARGLERYYVEGNPYYIGGVSKGAYPGSNMKIHIDGTGWCQAAPFYNESQQALYSMCRPYDGYWSEVFGVSDAALIAPNKTTRSLWNPWLVNQADIPARITQELNNGNYVYLPMADNGTHCYDYGCTKYELYYKKETTGEVVIVKSKHQQ